MGDPVKSTLTAKQQSDLDILMAKATERGFSEEQKTKARAKYLESLGLAESIRAKNIADTQEQERQYPKVDKTFEQEARKRLRDSGIDPNANPAEYRDSFGKVYDQVAAEHEAQARNVVKKKSPFGEGSLPGLGTDSKSTPEEVADWPEIGTIPSASPAQDPSAKKSIDMQLEYSKMMEEQAAKLAADEEAMGNIRDMLSGTSGVRSDVSDPYMGTGSQKLEVSQRGLRDKMNFISDKEKSYNALRSTAEKTASEFTSLEERLLSAMDLHKKAFESYWDEKQGAYVLPEDEKIRADFNESVAALTEVEKAYADAYNRYSTHATTLEQNRNELDKIYSEMAADAAKPEELGFLKSWATNVSNRMGAMLAGGTEFVQRWMPNTLAVNPVSFLLPGNDMDELIKKSAPIGMLSGEERVKEERVLRERSKSFADKVTATTGALLGQTNVLSPKQQAGLQEYMENNFVGASFISVASPEMATAFIPGAGPALMTAAFASSGYYDSQRAVDQAINAKALTDPDQIARAYNLGEAYAITLAGVTATLEKFGFSLVMNPLTKRLITSRVLAKLPSLGDKVGKRALEKLILAESSTLSRTLANKGITFVSGSIEEGVTEGLQTAADEGLRRLFNSTSDIGFDLFEESTAREFFHDVWESTAMGTVGGGMMHGTSVIFSGDPNQLSKDELAGAIGFLRKLPNLDGVKRAMLQGPAVPGGVVDDRFKNMTPQELEDAYQKVKGYWEAARSLPDDMDNYTAAVAISLVQQKQSLQKRMAKPGLDPAFIKKMEEKVGEIDEQLGKLFEEGVKPEDRVGVDEPTLTPKEEEGKKDEGKDTLSGWLGKMSQKAEGKAEPEKKTFSEWVSEMSKKEEESPADPDSEPMGFAGALQKLVEAADKGKEEKTFGEWLETLAPKAKEDAAAQEGAKEPFSSALSRLTEGKKEKDTPTGFSGILQKMFGQKVEEGKGKAQKETLGDALSRLTLDPNAEKMTLSQWLGQMTTTNPKEKKSFGEMLQEISPVEQVSALMEVEVEPGVSFGSLLSQLGKEQVPQGPMTLGDFLGTLQPTKKPQPRKPTAPKGSYAASEVDRVKGLDEASEDGATFNQDGSKYDKGGLVIPLASKNMSQEELTPEAIDAFIEENAGKVGSDKVKVGIYKFPNSNQVSIDLNIVAGRAIREQAIAIGKELGQESLFDLDSFENIKTGADGKNPKQLTDQEFVELQKRIEGLEAEAESKTKTDANETKPKPGNRLFNEPLQEVKRIADEYFARVFGKERPRYTGSKKLDTNRAKRISDAFQAMKNDPNNPRVKAAYEALAKETLDQYQAFLDAGYKVEINNSEPYANSKEMIDDLRDRKVIKIFSTESGFGDTPITDQQRAENPLLRDSGFSDMNGNPMLINDAFRAIHDFYGHAELGNSFGPKGEENAWNVHARMFSPLARAAMTTETRGQNSFVNFSGVNEEIEKMRDEARKLREQGDEAGAQAIVEQIYEKMSFADQKVGLLPDEFHQIDETDTGDVDVDQQVSQSVESASSKTGLTKIFERVFGLDKKKSSFAAQVSDAILGTIAKRAGITKEEAYRRISFAKITKEAFDKLSNRGKALFQIVGENAKLSEVIKENLSVARDMETSGLDAKSIRIATGWERGVDGKWKYEVDDELGSSFRDFLKREYNTLLKATEAWANLKKLKAEEDTIFSKQESAQIQDKRTELQRAVNHNEMSRSDAEQAWTSFLSQFDPEGRKARNREAIKRAQEELDRLNSLPVKKNSKDKKTFKLKDVVPKIAKLYPDLANIPIEITIDDNYPKKGEGGYVYDGKAPFIYILLPGTVTEQDAASILLHEIQHAIQEREGFARGGNDETGASLRQKVNWFKISEMLDSGMDANKISEATQIPIDIIEDAIPMINTYGIDKIRDVVSRIKNVDQLMKTPLWEVYRKIAGEVESRNVQKRMEMTPEQRRETTLRETEDVSTEEQIILFQGAQGAVILEDAAAVVYALTDPNVSTPVHELAHVYEQYLTEQERADIEAWSGHKAGTREFSEAFARGFEKYLSEGKAPTEKLKKAFENFKQWLNDIYNGIKGSEIDLELNDQMRDVYATMLGANAAKESRGVTNRRQVQQTSNNKTREQAEQEAEDFLRNSEDADARRLSGAIDRVRKSLEKVTGARVTVLRAADFKKYTGRDARVGGVFKIINGRPVIIINADSASFRVPYHELAHYVLRSAIGSNPKAFASAKADLIRAIRKDFPKEVAQEIISKLDEFADRYAYDQDGNKIPPNQIPDDVRAKMDEEWMVEFMAFMADSGPQSWSTRDFNFRKKGFLEKVADIISKFLNAVGIDLKLYDTKAQDMAEFVTVFANAASRGDNVVDVINLWKGPKPSGLFSNMTLESRNEDYMSLSAEERTKATKAAVKKGRSASTLSPDNPSMDGFDYEAYKADVTYSSGVAAIMLDKQLNVAPKKRQEIEEAVEKLKNANASPERIAKVRKRMEVENSGYIPGLAGIKLVPDPRPVSKSILESGDRKAISEARKRFEKRKAKAKELNAKKLDEINDRIKGNLLFLYENVKERVRGVSKLWYDGANIMAQDMSVEYGISHEQAAAAIAVCSPRTDWFQNMAIADHVVKFLTKESSRVIDADIVNGMKKGGETGWYPKWTGKGKLEGKTFAEAIEMVKAGEVPVNAVSHVLHYMGNSQLIPSYITSPDGIVMGPAVTASGKNKKTGFKEGAAIEKAVSIVLDGSPENVSKQLGGGHKVRNFYVNIIDPTVKHAVTIDTHAVAASWLFPYSSKAKVVSAIFGASGMGKNTKHDTSSYYWVYARAYTELANELGILPRELQSITWEAARSMFTEVTAKKSASFTPILEIYEAVDRGDLSIEEARQEIFDVAPGTNNGSLDKYNWEGQFFANDDAAESRGSAMFDFSGRNKKHPGVARAKVSGIIPDGSNAATADAAAMFLEHEMELRKKPLRERISKRFFDRQAHVRAALNRANAAIVEAKMVNSFGAAANAKQNFVRAHSKIYGGLSHDLNEALNTIIYLRRVIDVDATHDSKGKQRPKHPPFQDPNSTASIPMNKELAQQMLDQLTQDLGTDFFDLDNRANAYFDEFRKILGRKLEFGLITQEEFDRFVNNDYEPRLFVDKMLDQADNALLQGSAGMAGTSISDSQFNVIKNGSEMPLIKDSEWLLQNAWSSVERTGMRNRFFASLSELIGNPSVVADRNWVKAANTEMVYVSQPGQGVSVPGQSASVPATTQTAGNGTRATRVIKTDNFGNHIISKADTGYVNVYYRENGQLRAVQVRKEYAAEIVNPNAGTEASAIWRKVAKLTGVGILKPIATGMNALFPIANIPMDYMNVLMFTDAYDGNAFLGTSAFELFRDFSKNFAGLQVNDPQIMFNLEEALSYGMGMDFLSDQGRDFVDYTKRSGLDKLREKAGIGDRRSAATKAIEREELMVKIAGLGIAGDVSKNSELAMRMAVYQKVKAKALRQGMSPDEAKTYAASKARKTMDFSQGSAGAKVGDQFVAYLNAGLQAFRVAGSYISSNPKKFAGKMAQMGVASVIMSFMMHALMDDDEINEIPDYEFQRYFIIPTFGAIKNDEGNKGYFRIRINPQVAAFINPFRMIGRSLAKTAKGQEVDWRQEMAEYSLAIESGVPVVGGALSTMYKSMFEKGTNSSVFTDVMTQVMPPSVAAILAYWGNYDSFRDKAISTEKGDVPVEVEGLYDNRVHDTYKVAAKSMGLSPERLQVSAGKVLTDTHTNFAIAVSFALSDQVLGKLLLEEDERSGSQEIWSKAGRRVIRYGNPEWRKYKKSDEAKAFEQEENAIRYRIRENIKTMVRRDATDREIIDYVNKLDLGQEDKNYVVKYVESSRAVRNIDHPMKYELITMSYIRDPEAQAKYFYHEFGVVDNPDDVNEFRDILSKATGKKWNFSERFLNEYERLIEENKEKYK